MHRKAHFLGLATGLLLAGAATVSHAATVTPATARVSQAPEMIAVATTPATSAPWTVAPTPTRTLQWDPKGRWGFRLDMNEPVNRERGWKDVQAGAYFRITPSLRVGGSVGLTNRFTPVEPVVPTATQPRVRLETTFKF